MDKDPKVSLQGTVVASATVAGVIGALLLMDWKPMVLGVLLGMFFGIIVGYFENRSR